MGKKSIKENKNMYQLTRESCELTRDAASELLEFISSDRIEKIESDRSLPHPDEILQMARCYKSPYLCNYFCSHECPIGIRYVPEVQEKELSQIVLEMLASLNSLDKYKDRLVEITVDGEISEDEWKDFRQIQTQLKKISLSVSTLSMWLEKAAAEGRIAHAE